MIFNITPDANKLDLSALKTHTCTIPWFQFQIYEDGNVEVCCKSWLNKPIGNLLTDTAEQVLNSDVLKHIREDMLQGNYSYCNDACPFLTKFLYSQPENSGGVRPVYQWNSILSKEKFNDFIKKVEYVVYFNFDRTCNLQCPSCRNNLEVHTKSKAPAIWEKMSIMQKNAEDLVEILLQQENTKTVNVNLTGSGDPFASELYWNYLLKLNDLVLDPKYKKLKVQIQTNGLLMTPDRMNKLKNLWRRFDHISISIDAFTQETYSKVRKGGKLENVLNNIKWLDQKIIDGDIITSWDPGYWNPTPWVVNFVVQADNYKEMVDFAKYHLQAITLKRIWFNLIADWGHLYLVSPAMFGTKAIYREDHPEHANFLEVLKDPVFADKRVDAGSMTTFIHKAKNQT